LRIRAEKKIDKTYLDCCMGGWVKQSGPTAIAGICGSVATLLDPPYEIAPGG